MSNANYVHVDTNEQILKIGMELGRLEEWFNGSVFVWLHDVVESCFPDMIPQKLARCMELWAEYDALTKPIELYTSYSTGGPIRIAPINVVEIFTKNAKKAKRKAK